MANKWISQREARRLRNKVRELEHQQETQLRIYDRWCDEFPGGIHLVQGVQLSPECKGRVDAARLLRHAVVMVNRNGGYDLYAVK